MYKFKMKLLYNEEKLFCAKTKLLNFKDTLLLAKSDMVDSRLTSSGLVFSDVIPVDIHLLTFLLLSSISELSIEAKAKKFC